MASRPADADAGDGRMKVLVLGQGRTGTSSIRTALRQLGYENVYHMTTVLFQHPEHAAIWRRLFEKKHKTGEAIRAEELHGMLHDFDAVTDFPPAGFAEELTAAYPAAKVVLTTRDPTAWTRSVDKTIVQTVRRSPVPRVVAFLSPSFRQVYALMRTMTDLCFPPEFPAGGERVILAHNDAVRRCMAARPDDLLEFNVGDGWHPLCAFLGKEVPAWEFPRDNDAAAFGELLGKGLRVHMWPFVRAVGLVAVGIGVAYAAWMVYGG